MLLSIAAITTPYNSRAVETYLSSGCYFSASGNYYVTATVDPGTYSNLLSQVPAQGSLDMVLALYDASGNYMNSFYGTHNNNAYTYNVGSIPPSYQYLLLVRIYDQNGILIVNGTAPPVYGPLGLTEAKNLCDIREPWESKISGCKKGLSADVHLELDQAIVLYAVVNGYTPAILVNNSGNVSGPYAATTGITASTTSLEFINLFPGNVLPPMGCFNVELVFLDPVTGSIASSYSAATDICDFCPVDGHDDPPGGIPCNAAFSLTITSNTLYTSTLSFSSGIPTGQLGNSDTYEITDGATTWILSGSGSIILPNGTYDICHKVTRRGSVSCKECKKICFGDINNNAGKAGAKIIKPGTAGTIQNTDHFTLYPNPTNGNSVALVNLDTASNVSVEITDISGRAVIAVPAQKLEAGEHKIELKTTDLAPGLYNVKITTTKGAVTQKLTVVK